MKDLKGTKIETHILPDDVQTTGNAAGGEAGFLQTLLANFQAN